MKHGKESPALSVFHPCLSVAYCLLSAVSIIIPADRLATGTGEQAFIDGTVDGIADVVHRAVAEKEIHSGGMVATHGVGVENELVVGDMVAAAVSENESGGGLSVGQLIGRIGIALRRDDAAGYRAGPRSPR